MFASWTPTKPCAEIMQRGFTILGLGLVGALLAYGCLYFAGTSAKRQMLHSPQPELAWLKQEFKLSGAEFDRVAKQHAAYLPQCLEMCHRIDAQNAKLKTLLAEAATLNPEIEEAITEAARLRGECQRNMLRHFFDLSQTMPPEQGRRYLAWIKEKTILTGHGMGPLGHDAQP